MDIYTQIEDKLHDMTRRMTQEAKYILFTRKWRTHNSREYTNPQNRIPDSSQERQQNADIFGDTTRSCRGVQQRCWRPQEATVSVGYIRRCRLLLTAKQRRHVLGVEGQKVWLEDEPQHGGSESEGWRVCGVNGGLRMCLRSRDGVQVLS